MSVHKQLNDWGSIQNVVRGTDNFDVHLELAFQTKDRKSLEKLVSGTDVFNADFLMIQVIFFFIDKHNFLTMFLEYPSHESTNRPSN